MGKWLLGRPTSDMQPGAVEVPQRPSNAYIWDGAQWVYDSSLDKDFSRNWIDTELGRLNKFWHLPSLIYQTIEADLIAYSEALRQYVKTLDANSVLPQCPATLTDTNFYAL